MTRPQAYQPMKGYKYQILVKTPYSKALESCDYAKDKKERDHLLENYIMAYGSGFSFKVITLPKKYWE